MLFSFLVFFYSATESAFSPSKAVGDRDHTDRIGSERRRKGGFSSNVISAFPVSFSFDLGRSPFRDNACHARGLDACNDSKTIPDLTQF